MAALVALRPPAPFNINACRKSEPEPCLVVQAPRLFTPHPSCEHLPVGVILRESSTLTAVEVISPGFGCEGVSQEAAHQAVSRLDVALDHFEVLPGFL